MGNQKQTDKNSNREKSNKSAETTSPPQKTKNIFSLFDYKSTHHRALLYGAILIVSCLIGSLSAVQVRGSYSNLSQLVWISIGWVTPLLIAVIILWKVKETTSAELIDFVISLFLFMVIAVLLQWGFYKFGSYFGKKDFNHAITLCLSAENWGKKKFEDEEIKFDRVIVPASAISSSPHFLGNIHPPEVLRYQKHHSNIDTFGLEHLKIDSFYFCRFTDPRISPRGGGNIYTYDYQDKYWMRGVH